MKLTTHILKKKASHQESNLNEINLNQANQSSENNRYEEPLLDEYEHTASSNLRKIKAKKTRKKVKNKEFTSNQKTSESSNATESEYEDSINLRTQFNESSSKINDSFLRVSSQYSQHIRRAKPKLSLLSVSYWKKTDEIKKDDDNLLKENIQLRPFVDFVQKPPIEQISTFENLNSLSLLPFKYNENNLLKYNGNNSSLSAVNNGAQAQIELIKYKKSSDDKSLKEAQLQKRYELRSLVIFIFFLFVTIITLSQILVMHSQTNSSNLNQIKFMQEELRLMDQSIDRLLKERHVVPMQLWFAIKQYNDSLKRFSHFIDITNNMNLFASIGEDYLAQADSSYNHTNTNSTSESYQNYPYNSFYINDEQLIGELFKCQSLYSHLSLDNPNSQIINLTVPSSHSKLKNGTIFAYLIKELIKMKSLRTLMFSSAIRIGKKSAISNTRSTTTLKINAFVLNANTTNLIIDSLEDYLNLTNLLEPIENNTTQSQKFLVKRKKRLDACLNHIIYSVYYIFNQHYTYLFENNQKEFTKHLLDNFDLFNRTLVSNRFEATINKQENIRENNNILKNLYANDSNGFLYLKMPIRNMNTYYNRYKQSKNKFDRNQTLCNPQPPLLCKIFALILLIRQFKAFCLKVHNPKFK
jgi:hypothetical protein